MSKKLSKKTAKQKTPENGLSNLDKTAIGVVMVCALLVGIVIFVGGRAPIQVKANLPEDDLIGPYQTITLTFSDSVNQVQTAPLFKTQPHVNGLITWLDSRTMQFIPSEPFQRGTSYKIFFNSGIVGDNGRKLKNGSTWNVQVRETQIAYLNTSGNQNSIWLLNLTNNQSHQLTDDSVKVIGFDASRNGEFIVFYSLNNQGGIDLWQVTRAGASSLLLDCGRDRCTTPAISPDGLKIAYSREAAGPNSELPYGSPRIYVLNLQSKQNAAVYADQKVLGYNPSWSPNSSQLASYDGLADQIRLLNITTGDQYAFSSNTGGPVTWSPDDSKFLYTEAEQNEAGVRTFVQMADLNLNKTFNIIGSEDDMDYGYYSIAWSPVEDSVVLGMRAGGDDPSQIFWLFNPSHLDGVVIASELNYAYNSPRWSVWGDAILFQQFKLKGAYKPEIGLWQKGFQEPIVLAEGLMPHWLP